MLAFPSAEGFGKYTKGGRGGVVYHVTNLRDDGPGSLRFGIDTADNPRTIVFDVAGAIELTSPIRMENKSYLTIAGPTAPGKGITIRDHAMVINKCSNVVVRYLRLRLGDKNKGDSSGEDVMTVDYCDQIILDHLSLSWGIDGNSDYRGNSNMTLQWLLYAEALHNSLHPKGAHAMCTSLRDCHGNTTLHHNIYSTSQELPMKRVFDIPAAHSFGIVWMKESSRISGREKVDCSIRRTKSVVGIVIPKNFDRRIGIMIATECLMHGRRLTALIQKILPIAIEMQMVTNIRTSKDI